MRRQQVIEREAESGHARGHGAHQKDRRRSIEPFPYQQPVHHEESGTDADYANHYMNESECR
jgi:hypothetical protein